jgi:hypothetical protein
MKISVRAFQHWLNKHPLFSGTITFLVGATIGVLAFVRLIVGDVTSLVLWHAGSRTYSALCLLSGFAGGAATVWLIYFVMPKLNGKESVNASNIPTAPG